MYISSFWSAFNLKRSFLLCEKLEAAFSPAKMVWTLSVWPIFEADCQICGSVVVLENSKSNKPLHQCLQYCIVKQIGGKSFLFIIFNRPKFSLALESIYYLEDHKRLWTSNFCMTFHCFHDFLGCWQCIRISRYEKFGNMLQKALYPVCITFTVLYMLF